MQPDLNRVIEQVSKEKGIDRQIIVEALEQAMLSAAKKTFGHEKNIEAKFNPDVGEVELFEIKTVVDVVEDAENQVTLCNENTEYTWLEYERALEQVSYGNCKNTLRKAHGFLLNKVAKS